MGDAIGIFLWAVAVVYMLMGVMALALPFLIAAILIFCLKDD